MKSAPTTRYFSFTVIMVILLLVFILTLPNQVISTVLHRVQVKRLGHDLQREHQHIMIIHILDDVHTGIADCVVLQQGGREA